MVCNYKFFTERLGNDAMSSVPQVRKYFPGMHVLQGMHKDRSGLFIIKNLTNYDYSDPIELENGDIYWAPKSLSWSDIHESQSDWSLRIPVTLNCGETIQIVPAQSTIQKIKLSDRKKIGKKKSPYCDRYNQLVAELYERSTVDPDSIGHTDPQILELVELALSISYDCPFMFFDQIEALDEYDLFGICMAAFGISSLEELKKKVEGGSLPLESQDTKTANLPTANGNG
jgi:hypothetical protein